MLIRSILTIAVLGSFVFGAAAQAEPQRHDVGLSAPATGANVSGLGLGGTR